MTPREYARLVGEHGLEVFKHLVMDGGNRWMTLLLPLPIDTSPDAAMDTESPALDTVQVRVPDRQGLLAHEGQTFRAILADLVHSAIWEANLWPAAMSTWDMEQFPESWRPPPGGDGADYISFDEAQAYAAPAIRAATNLVDVVPPDLVEDVRAIQAAVGEVGRRALDREARRALGEVIEATRSGRSSPQQITDVLHETLGNLTIPQLTEAGVERLREQLHDQVIRLEVTNRAGEDVFARAVGAEVLRQAAAAMDRETQAVWDANVHGVEGHRALQEMFPGHEIPQMAAEPDEIAGTTLNADQSELAGVALQSHDMEEPPLPKTEAAHLSWDEWVKQSADLLDEYGRGGDE